MTVRKSPTPKPKLIVVLISKEKEELEDGNGLRPSCVIHAGHAGLRRRPACAGDPSNHPYSQPVPRLEAETEGALSQPMAMQLQAHSITTPQSFYSQLYYLTAAQPGRHSQMKPWTRLHKSLPMGQRPAIRRLRLSLSYTYIDRYDEIALSSRRAAQTRRHRDAGPCR
jgi:hypothetical protein